MYVRYIYGEYIYTYGEYIHANFVAVHSYGTAYVPTFMPSLGPIRRDHRDHRCRGRFPDMPYIHNLLPNIGHRFGHQAGLDESSGRISTLFLRGIASCVYFMSLMFCQIDKNRNTLTRIH